MIYFIVSIILDNICSSVITTTYQNINYFFSMIFISSIPISYLVIKNKKLVFISFLIIGIIYDLLYSNILFINVYYLILYYLFLKTFYDNNKATILNIIIISLLGIIIYDGYIFFVLVIFNKENLLFTDLLYKESRSIFLNLLYILISLLLLKSRIFVNKKYKIKP